MFFPIHCNPPTLHVEQELILERDLRKSHSYWLTIFFYNPAAQFWERRGRKILKIKKKTQYMINTLYVFTLSGIYICNMHVSVYKYNMCSSRTRALIDVYDAHNSCYAPYLGQVSVCLYFLKESNKSEKMRKCFYALMHCCVLRII